MKITPALCGTVVAVVATVVSGFVGFWVWDQGLEEHEHEILTQQQVAGDVELDLQRVELELKLLRTIEERRPLTADEQDRKDYLLALRMILREQQNTKVG